MLNRDGESLEPCETLAVIVCNGDNFFSDISDPSERNDFISPTKYWGHSSSLSLKIRLSCQTLSKVCLQSSKSIDVCWAGGKYRGNDGSLVG